MEKFETPNQLYKTEDTKSILKETEIELRKVKILSNNLAYVSLYHLAHVFNSMEKHELSRDICNALLNDLAKQEL